MKAQQARSMAVEACKSALEAEEYSQRLRIKTRTRQRRIARKLDDGLQRLEVLLHTLRMEVVDAAINHRRHFYSDEIFNEIAALADEIAAAESEIGKSAPFLPPCFSSYNRVVGLGLLQCARLLMAQNSALAAIDRRFASMVEDPRGDLPRAQQELLFELIYADPQRARRPATGQLRAISLSGQSEANNLSRLLDARQELEDQIGKQAFGSASESAIAWGIDFPENLEEFSTADLESLFDDRYDRLGYAVAFDPSERDDPLWHPRLLERTQSGRVKLLLNLVLGKVSSHSSDGVTTARIAPDELLGIGIAYPSHLDEILDCFKLVELLGYEVSAIRTVAGALDVSTICEQRYEIVVSW